MDEARASCAIDISGRGLLAFDARAAAGRDRQLRPRARRGVLPRPRREREADPARDRRGGDERPPHDRGDVQGARAGAAGGGGDRPDRDRRAEHEGDARMSAAPAIAIVDYGMGNRRSVQKAFEHVGAQREITRDHDVLRDADALVVPGVGAFPLAMANLQGPRPRRADPRAGRQRDSDPRHLPRHAAAVRPLARARGDRRSRAVQGDVTPIDSGGLRIPHIGWNEVRFEHPTRRSPSGLPADGCPFYHVHSLAARPDPRRGRHRHDRVRRAVRDDRRARVDRSGCSSTRRSPPDTACEMLGNFARLAAAQRASSASAVAAMILLPAIDILDGKAVRLAQGRLRREDRLRRRSARRRAAVGRGGRSAAARRRPRRRSHRDTGEPRARPPDRRGGRRPGSGRGRPALDRRGPRRRRGRSLTGSCSARRRSPTSISSTTRSPCTPSAWSCPSMPGRASSPPRVGRSRRRSRFESVIQRMGDRGVRRFVFSSIDRDGTMGGPDLDGVNTIAAGGARELHLLGRDLVAR